MPAALSTTLEKRSSFETLVLQQFETGMSERLDKCNEEIGSLASSKIEETGTFNNVSAFVSTAKDTYEASLAALQQAQADQRDAQATHEDAVLKVKSWRYEHDAAWADCESAQHNLIAFQTGALAAFYNLEKRVAQTPNSTDSSNEGSALGVTPAALALQTGLTESIAVEKVGNDMREGDEMAVCSKMDVAEQVEAQKLEDPVMRGVNFGSGTNEKIKSLECMPPLPPEQSMGAVAGA